MVHLDAHNRAKKVDLYKAFFKFKANRVIVLDAFSKMESYYRQYDADGNRRFSLQVFFIDLAFVKLRRFLAKPLQTALGRCVKH